MKENKIKTICLVFENCESLTINIEDIEYLYLTDIQDNYFKKIRKPILEHQKTANFVMIEIKMEADEYLKNDKGLFQFEDEAPLGIYRILRYEDITQINISYDDGTESIFFPIWSNENEFYNSYQKSYIIEKENNSENTILITISNNEKRMKEDIDLFIQNDQDVVQLKDTETLEDLKENILSKLSKEERKILGI